MPFAAQNGHQFVVHHLDDLLTGVKPAQHRRAQGALTNVGHELLDDAEVDIGLQEGESDLAERDVEVGLRDLRLAAKALGDRLEACGQGFEHG